MQFTPITSRAKDEQALSELADYLQLRMDASSSNQRDRVLEICFSKARDMIEKELGQALLDRRLIAKCDWSFPQRVKLDLGGLPRVVEVAWAGGQTSSDEFWFELQDENYVLVSQHQSIKNLEIVIAQGAEDWASLADEFKWLILSSAAHFYEFRNGENGDLPRDIKIEIAKYRLMRVGFEP